MTSIQMSDKDEMVEQFLDCASRGDLAKVSTMITHYTQLLNESGRQGWTALMLAARNGHFDVVKALLLNGYVCGCELFVIWGSVVYHRELFESINNPIQQ